MDRWNCTLERDPEAGDQWLVRLGFNYLKGLRRETAASIVEQRSREPFASIRDLVRRVPGIRKEEFDSLSEAGALNFIEQDPLHRREALWRGELAARPVGELFETRTAEESAGEQFDDASPLSAMTPLERLAADYRITGLTIGVHPMRMHRDAMDRLGVLRASALAHIPDGRRVRIAGAVICRQRPGTANGLVFLSLEDETGISNAMVLPDLFETYKLTIVEEPFLLLEGILQNQRGSVSVKAEKAEGLRLDAASLGSHDFH